MTQLWNTFLMSSRKEDERLIVRRVCGKKWVKQRQITSSYRLRSVLTALRAVLGLAKRDLGMEFALCCGTLACAALRPTSCSCEALSDMFCIFSAM